MILENGRCICVRNLPNHPTVVTGFMAKFVMRSVVHNNKVEVFDLYNDASAFGQDDLESHRVTSLTKDEFHHHFAIIQESNSNIVDLSLAEILIRLDRAIEHINNIHCPQSWNDNTAIMDATMEIESAQTWAKAILNRQ